MPLTASAGLAAGTSSDDAAPESARRKPFFARLRLANLDAPTLWRAAAVMRNRRHVADRGDGEADGLQGAQCRFASRAGTLDLDLERPHAVLHRLLAGILGSHLRGIGRRFARALEALAARGRPGDRIALGVGDGDDRIVERRVHMRDAGGDVLAF